jgi:hypothetical protein
VLRELGQPAGKGQHAVWGWFAVTLDKIRATLRLCDLDDPWDPSDDVWRATHADSSAQCDAAEQAIDALREIRDGRHSMKAREIARAALARLDGISGDNP